MVQGYSSTFPLLSVCFMLYYIIVQAISPQVFPVHYYNMVLSYFSWKDEFLFSRSVLEFPSVMEIKYCFPHWSVIYNRNIGIVFVLFKLSSLHCYFAHAHHTVGIRFVFFIYLYLFISCDSLFLSSTKILFCLTYNYCMVLSFVLTAALTPPRLHPSIEQSELIIFSSFL